MRGWCPGRGRRPHPAPHSDVGEVRLSPSVTLVLSFPNGDPSNVSALSCGRVTSWPPVHRCTQTLGIKEKTKTERSVQVVRPPPGLLADPTRGSSTGRSKRKQATSQQVALPRSPTSNACPAVRGSTAGTEGREFPRGANRTAAQELPVTPSVRLTPSAARNTKGSF